MAKLNNNRKDKDFEQIIDTIGNPTDKQPKNVSESNQNKGDNPTDNLPINYDVPETKQVSVKFDYETHKRLVLAKAHTNIHIKDYIIKAVKKMLDEDKF